MTGQLRIKKRFYLTQQTLNKYILQFVAEKMQYCRQTIVQKCMCKRFFFRAFKTIKLDIYNRQYIKKHFKD